MIAGIRELPYPVTSKNSISSKPALTRDMTDGESIDELRRCETFESIPG